MKKKTIELLFRNTKEELITHESKRDFFEKLEKATRAFYKKVSDLSDEHQVPMKTEAHFSITGSKEATGVPEVQQTQTQTGEKIANG